MRDTLKEAPPELYDFYNLSMKRIEHDKTAKGVLLVLLCARRRLHILEVKQAIAVQKGASSAAAMKDYEVNEQILRECCAGLVIVDTNSIVEFSHESVREFLSNREKPNKIFDSDPETVMAWTCLKYLSHVFPISGPCDDPKSYRERLKGYPLLRYAAEHWGHHVRVSNSEETLMEQILAFLRQDRKLPSVLQALSVSNEQDDVLSFPSEVHGLWIAAHFGLANVLKRLLKTRGTNVNILDSYGQTALLVATQEALTAPATSVLFEDVNLSGYEECVRVLLEKGADSNIKSVSGWTPLLVSAGKGNTAIVKLLLDSEPKPNTEEIDPSGDTALLRAAKRNHAQTVEALSDDADVEAQDKYGETALIVTARRWDEDTLRVLLDCGANLNARDRFGDTALLKAAKLGRALTSLPK
jgi:ankyrin repeat protein